MAALALTVLEGAIRKWVIGSTFEFSSYIVYFSKDLVFALLLFLPAQTASSPVRDVFGRWLCLGCFLLLCGALGSVTQDLNLAGAMLTLRALIFLPIVAFLVAPRLRGLSLRSVALVLGILTILNFALGVVQNHLLPQDMLNRYATGASDISTTQTGVRATGTFSYITGMGTISVVGIWAGMIYVSLGENIRQQAFGWAVIASGVGCGLASVSRGPIVLGAVMIGAWLLFSGAWATTKSRALTAGVLLAGLFAAFELTTTFLQLTQGLLLRAETANDTTRERGFVQVEEAVIAMTMAPFGSGLGTEQIGRNHYGQGAMASTTFESQWGRLVLETGILGLGGFIIVGAGSLIALEFAKRRATKSGESAAYLATQLLMVSLFATNTVYNHVASAFVWMIFSAVLGASIRIASAHASLVERPVLPDSATPLLPDPAQAR